MIELQWGDTSEVQSAPVSREEIDSETDVPTLIGWLDSFEARIVEQRAFCQTWDELGWTEEGKKRFGGKLAFAKMGKTWVTRRLRRLGHDPRSKLEKDVAATQVRVQTLSIAARKVIKQRDGFAETGVYPFPMESDQQFDDWAADVLEEALPNSLATDEVT